MSGLLLIDGHSLAYRAFHALPDDLRTASGQVTNAVYGFTSMLVNLLRDHAPERVAVAFDLPGGTFRHERLDSYKANRSKPPEIFREQLGLLREVLDVLGVRTVEAPGFEADDILATLATEAAAEGLDAAVVTGDRDAFQLVADPHVTVLYPRRGMSDHVRYDEAGIEARTGVRPADYVDYAALRGDTSDNLPGVPGVGEKTAARLVNAHGGIDGIYAHLDEQTPRLRSSLQEAEQAVRLNCELMELRRDLDLPVTVGDLTVTPAATEEILRLFEFLEFGSLLGRLGEALGLEFAPEVDAEVLEVAVEQAGDVVAAVARMTALAQSGRLAVAGAWRGRRGRSEFEGLALIGSDEGQPDPPSPTGESDAGAARSAVWIPGDLLDGGTLREVLGGLFGEGGPGLVAHDARDLMRSLLAIGIDVRSLSMDTAIAAYLLDPSQSDYPVGDLLARYAGCALAADGAEEETQGRLAFPETGEALRTRTALEALAAARLAEPLRAALREGGAEKLHDTIEVPLVRVLARMEHCGVGVDLAGLEALTGELDGEATRLRAAVVADAGEEFNVNSPQQLARVLFERLGLPPQKRTKTGYSTDAATLERLRGEHDIVEHLLAYREVEKLRSTYGHGLAAEVDPDTGRIHASFNQTVARTGRLSSDAPNLHNIPVRTETGRAFRKVFVPAAGTALLIADYNQIELRCIAHLADDPGLITAFEAGEDIHTATAARVFGVAPADVTTELRSKAKMVSYGLAYGMESYGLAQRLSIPTEEAQVILDAYFGAFPAVRDYMDTAVARARELGYTETLYGRRRPIPELRSDNFRVRQAGERQAKNAGIQGLAADIFKVALVHIDGALERDAMASRLILQVHDEVILEVPDAERSAAAELVHREMAAACDLRVPLVVDLAFGSTWAAAKA
ncbi:MAG: DNA polymerase I [Acidimicrobiia bacterium]|nr:DNA polymerase I [Acidimicrobiia bacterium]MYC45510.1 DNA polymerase I [Acidimicrobiia bacterium]MYI20234.1 DNA polymerase I [Acidimicrobiia bacterium]